MNYCVPFSILPFNLPTTYEMKENDEKYCIFSFFLGNKTKNLYNVMFFQGIVLYIILFWQQSTGFIQLHHKKNIPPKAKMQPQLDIRVQWKKILEMQEINSDTTALGWMLWPMGFSLSMNSFGWLFVSFNLGLI